MIVMILINSFVGVLDGIGLAMFIPLLELVSNESGQVEPESLGNMGFILRGIQYMGLSLNLSVILFIMLLFFSLKGIFKFATEYLQVKYRVFFMTKIRLQSINSLAEYDYQTFVEADAGKIQNTLGGESEKVSTSFRTYSVVLQQVILTLTYFALAFTASPEFSILVAIGGGLSNFLFTRLYNRTKIISNELVRLNHGFHGLLIQMVNFFKYLKATGSIQGFADYLRSKAYGIENQAKKIGVINGIMQGLREPLMMLIVVLVILAQVNLMDGKLSAIILSLLFFYRGLASIMLLQSSYNNFLAYSGSLRNMEEFLADLRAHSQQTGTIEFDAFNDNISLKGLSFGYGNNVPVLNDINLSIKKGEVVAFVGESGSGKTTLMNLIAGILNASADSSYDVDGTPFSEIERSSFQKRIGYITQEPVVFDDSIYNNITFWQPKTDENLVRFEKAARKAHIWEFIQSQSDKEDARLGNNGVNLSGGQKQRISIARELFKNLDILFLDEATSALDSETEKIIQRSIDELKGGYTIMIIAHRLSTIRNADRVFVLKNGRLEAQGSFDELMKSSKVFQRMVQLQEV